MMLLFYLALLNLTLFTTGAIGDLLLYFIYKLDGGKLSFWAWFKK